MASAREWVINGQPLTRRSRPWIMGIVNATPDSFSDGGQFFDPQRAVDHAMQLEAEGADVLDLGGESTRPGSVPVPVVEELRRVMPVVERLAGRVRIPLSIDTTKAEVARQALQAGASIINDISGLTFDPEMPAVLAGASAGVVCMHIQGTPQTMQADPHYDNVVSEVREWLRQRLERLKQQGIAAERVLIDPGIGFGKTAVHNLELLSHISMLQELGRPVLIGHSRKRFLKRVLGREVDERLFGTLGVTVALAEQGCEMVRVHDVAATADLLTAWATVREWSPTAAFD